MPANARPHPHAAVLAGRQFDMPQSSMGASRMLDAMPNSTTFRLGSTKSWVNSRSSRIVSTKLGLHSTSLWLGSPPSPLLRPISG